MAKTAPRVKKQSRNSGKPDKEWTEPHRACNRRNVDSVLVDEQGEVLRHCATTEFATSSRGCSWLSAAAFQWLHWKAERQPGVPAIDRPVTERAPGAGKTTEVVHPSTGCAVRTGSQLAARHTLGKGVVVRSLATRN